jgi:hypothetical protein
MHISELLRSSDAPRLVGSAFSACVILLAGWTGDGSPNVTAPATPNEIDGTVVKTPIEETVTQFEACAGEVVEFHLREQVVFHESVDAQGKVHIHVIVNDKGTTAVGLTSGATFHQVGATLETDKFVASLPTTISFVNVLHLIGEGSVPDVRIHETFHLTINAKGVVTVERPTLRTTCK